MAIIPPHESPPVMLIPLAVLALGATFAGIAFRHWFIGDGVDGFWRSSLFLGQENHILEEMEHVPALVSLLADADDARRPRCRLSTCTSSIKKAPERLADIFPALYRFLLNKWYFDELYDFDLRPSGLRASAALFWKGGDGAIIDGLGPDGVSARVLDVTRNVVRLQSGYVYQYAFAMLLGVAALATWYLFGGGR